MSEPREHNDAADPAVEPAPGCDIAIVGMSGRFPGAHDVAELWANIRAGASGITRFGDAELRAAGVPERLLADPGYVKAGAVLDGIDLFDASFFGVGPKEAQILDPQHRLFLEHSWQALEDAGCDPSRLDGTVGVFGGSAWSSYLSNNVAPSGVGAVMGELAVGLANDKDSLTTRVAHTLGLSGPTYGIQSYCSTSLVAVCAAASSLAGMECDLALAGGVAVAVPHRVGYLYQQGGIAPPDAECRAFDAAGLGSPVGSGVGVVVLRRLEDALADGDQVYAVIRGWAVNNDGGRKVGFTAPGVQGQAEVIAEALSTADLAPSEIDYIEAHGTGTALGDAAELAALQQVFRGESCLIGSIKTNVGHLDRAAGVTGLIKAALALRHEEIPPTRGLRTLNPQLKTGAASLEVVTELTDWPRRSGRPRRAGVSAFGIGGTNAHVVLQEAPRRVRVDGPARPELLVWSARDAEAADAMTDRLATHLDDTSDGLGDVAYTLQLGRRLFEHRRMTVAESVDVAVAGLRGVGVRGRREAGSERGVAFLIAGTGEQYAGMAADLYRSEPLFREILDECRDGLAPRLGFDPLEDMLRPREAVSAGGAGLSWLLGRETAPADAGQATDRLQPATFAVEYALARLLTAWGVEPTVMAGYSLGEYVAACLSGVLSLDAALALVARRAQLIAGLPAGAMAAVPLSAEEVEDRISRSGGSLDIAALNGPKLTVVAGPPAEVHRFREFLEGEATPCRPLSTSHAFHSRMLEPIRDELTAWVRANVTVGTPRLPYLSNVTGELVTAKQLADPGYWAEHMCAPVRFDAALGGVLERGDLAVVEIGPGQSLGAMLRGRPDCPRERWPLVMPSLPAAGETSAASTVLMEAVGRLWLAGVPVDWAAFQAGRGLAKVHVPGYPLRRQRYWIEPPLAVAELNTPLVEAVAAPACAAVPTGIRPDHVRLVTPVWSELPLAAPAAEKTPIVLLADTGGVGVAVADLLGAKGADVRLETVPDDPAELVARLGTEPATVVDLRLLDRAEDALDGPVAVLPVAAVLDAWGQGGAPTAVILVTRGGQATSAGQPAAPEHAAVGALAAVANQEYLNLTCRVVDLDPADSTCATVSALAAELTGTSEDVLTAYRAGVRRVRGFEPGGSAGAGPAVAVRPGGSYLITGGLGDVGLLVAEHLARTGAGRLVLTSRSGAPAADDERREILDRLRAMGADVLTPAVDVTDAQAMQALVAELLHDGGALHGIVHAAAQTGPDTFRVLRDLDADTIGLHFGAKVTGAQVIETVLADLPEEQAPDFCVVFSSTSAILGGLAFGSYAAANAALTALAGRHRGDPTTWVSTAWDTWACTVPQISGGVGAAMLAHSMSIEEALEAFDAALADPQPNLIVTAGGWTDRLPVLTAATAPGGDGTRYPRPDLSQPYSPPLTTTERALAEVWSEVLGVEPVGTRDNFFDLSGNSLLALQMLALVKQRMGHAVPSVALFEAPTVHALAALLDAQSGGPQPIAAAAPVAPAAELVAGPVATDRDDRIAVVGMAGRFPGAGDVASFWQNLRDGVESISFFSPEELIASGVDPALVQDPAYVPARPVLDDVAGFDAGFFGMSPRMAALTDPQQRLFLEVCWEALEQSGYAAPGEHRVGVYGGTNLSTYLLRMPEQMFADEEISTYEIIMGNEKDALTTTVSYLFDLRGPSVAVQTFCSTSLVATHLAVQSLRAGDCELALAGGVSIRVPDRIGHRFAPGGMESPDGHVRTFDAQAKGSMFGDGAAVVVLKRLSNAVRDGDHIWSVIRGSAMNNDGALKVGYTAPSVVGQARVIADAMADAGISGEDVSYIEAHGTATELGDPIEVAALTRAFGPTASTQYCPIGSVKTNIGHLDRAAGVTGLIKTSLALRDGVIPPSLHYTAPNPDIDFEHSPFYVNTTLAPWRTRDGRTPIAGINSLGMGGTNVHVVVEQAPVRSSDPGTASDAVRRQQVLPVSARTATAAEQSCARLAEHLHATPQVRLADAAYTLQVGRRTFEHRRVAVANSTAAAAAALADGRVRERVDAARGRPVAFVFPDADDTVAATVSELYRREPVFRAALDECAELVRRDRPDVDLIGELTHGAEPASAGATAVRTDLAGLTTFAVQYALARTLITWGVQPGLLAGYGTGQRVTTCLSGRLDLADALALVSHRGGAGAGPPAVRTLTGDTADPTLLADRELVLLEIGPATVLADLARETERSADPALSVRVLPAPGAAATDDESLAEALAQLWLLGVDVDWAAYSGRAPGGLADDGQLWPGRVPLPTYPFQRSRYWIEAAPKTPGAAATAEPANLFEAIASLPKLPEDQWLHLPVWRQTVNPAPGPQPESWLVFTREGVADEAAMALRDSGSAVSLVRPGERFATTDDGFTVRPGVTADLLAVLRALRAAGRPLERAVHLWSLEPSSAGTAYGLDTLVALAQAAAEVGGAEWAMDVVVAGTQEVVPGDVTDPEAAMVTGPCLVVPLEYPGVTARLVDVSSSPAGRSSRELVAELRRSPTDWLVALRHGRRWLPGYESLPVTDGTAPFRDGGVYLVTGGLGGIALGLAERLAVQHRARLVLLARRGLDGTDEASRRRNAEVARLQELGAEVEVVVGDVTDPDAVGRAVAVARERFGALHGVLHAAGVPGMGLMQFKRPQEMQQVLAPKVAGTRALAEALRIGEADEVELDFLVLFSSITTATGGGPGQVDYCAANAFLDGWAAQHAVGGRRVLAVDWGEWTWNAWEDGLAGYDDSLQEFFRANRARFGIGFDEGWRSLVRALASGESRVVVSTQDFQTVVTGSAQFTVDAVRPAAEVGGERFPRPELTTMYQEPNGPVEVAVARSWCDALRLQEIGVQDNFFELGGNSLLGVSIVTTLRREFELDELAPHILYEAPTVAALAAVIEAAAAGEPSTAAPDDNASQVRAQLRRSGLESSAAARRRAR